MLNRINSILVIGLASLMLRVDAVQVSDTTGDDSSNAARIKIKNNRKEKKFKPVLVCL